MDRRSRGRGVVTTFTATLVAIPSGGHYVVVPAETVAAAGLAHGVRVRGTLGGVAYRSSLMIRSGVVHLGVHKATVTAAKATPGTDVAVTIEIDDQPLPTDTVPRDLAKAIAANAKAKAGWATQSPSHKREYVKHVIDAVKPETRAKRIASTIKALAAIKPKKR